MPGTGWTRPTRKPSTTFRKALKRTRAVLRLVRDGFPDLGRENAALREAARSLSATRDAQVVVTTLDRLLEDTDDAEDAVALRSVRDALGPVAAVTVADPDRPAQAPTVGPILDAVRSRAEAWDLSSVRVPTVQHGLARTYGRGREALLAASREPTSAALHAWRRRAKDLWYQLRLLEPAWPGVLGAQVEAAGTLGEQLGDDHDLALVTDAITHASASRELADRAQAAVHRRRVKVQRDVFVLGQRVYVESPRAFAERTIAYLRLWRAEARLHQP